MREPLSPLHLPLDETLVCVYHRLYCWIEMSGKWGTPNIYYLLLIQVIGALIPFSSSS